MPRLGVFASLAILCPVVAVANACNGNDNCNVDDATSLMQLQSVVQRGHSREASTEEAQYTEEWGSEAEEENSDEAGKFYPWRKKKKFLFKVPAGCRRPVCVGRAPFCGGNTEDCTSRNKVVIGWTKKCFEGSWATCLTGWKVHCAVCGKHFKNVKRPEPKPLLPLWIAPKRKAKKVEKKKKEKPPIKLPKFEVPEFSYKYKSSEIKDATKDLRKAYKHISEYKAVVCNLTELVEDVKKNITLFEERERKMYETGIQMRSAAVRYAKKKVLANITLAKAEKAMDDAYMAQKGAQNAALRMVAVATNQKLHKVASAKRLIDKKEDLIKAQDALRIGQIAVNHAAAQLAQAKRLAQEQTAQRRKEGYERKLINHRNTEFAEELYVKKKMEKAYAKASPRFGKGLVFAGCRRRRRRKKERCGKGLKRKRKNVPAWGSDSFVSAYDAGPPCQCVQGSKDCPCSWARTGKGA